MTPSDPEALLAAARYRLRVARALLSQGGDCWAAAADHVFHGWHCLLGLRSVRAGDEQPSREAVRAVLGEPPADLLGSAHVAGWQPSFQALIHVATRSQEHGFEGGSISGTDLSAAELRAGVERQAVFLARALRRIGREVEGIRPRRWLAVVAGVVVLIALGSWISWPRPDPLDFPESTTRNLEHLSEPRRQGDPFDQEGNAVFRVGLTLDLGRTWYPTSMSVAVDNNDSYAFAFTRGGDVVETVTLPIPAAGDGPAGDGAAGVVVHELPLPPSIAARGTDRVIVTTPIGDGLSSVGHFILSE